MKTILLLFLFVLSAFGMVPEFEHFKVFCSATPKEYLVVEIKSELDGTSVFHCMAIFVTDTKYRFVDPTFDKLDLQKNNNAIVSVKKVKK